MNIEKGIELRKMGKLEESNSFFIELVKKNPDNGQANYQCAWSYDVLGNEHDAIYYYEKSIKLGLADEDLKEAYLGLGSTYRTIGEYEKSRETLEKGIGLFEENSLKVFYAMTLYNLNEHEKAMEILLDLIAHTSDDKSVVKYKKAIEFYSDRLDELF